MTDSREPTDRFWLDHEAAIVDSGQTAKTYAAEQGLSVHAFYQARKRLRALGLLAASESRPRKKRKAKSRKFSKVELLSPQRTRPDFRLGLPSGLTLEWSGTELPSPVVDLLERLIQVR